MENIHLSYYTIPVKLEDEENKYLLVHGYTGAIDIVDGNIWEELKNYSPNSALSPEATQLLQKRGYLTVKNKEEEKDYVIRLAQVLYRKELMRQTDFTWIITYNCNFRCPYCFEKRDVKDSNCNIAFTKEMVDRAYIAMTQIQPQFNRIRKTITLYGGEPLLAVNRDIVEYIVEKGHELGYRFVAVTNGYELDKFVDLLSVDKIYKVQITIDGPKEFHNQRRIHYKDIETFDKIVDNILIALHQNIEVSVRMNTDNENIDKFLELENYFSQLGCLENPKFNLYSASITDNEEISMSEQKQLNFISGKSYIKIHKQQGTLNSCINYGIVDSIYRAIIQQKAIALRSTFCSSQVSGYVLDPFGKIYPCWEVVGKDDYLIGVYDSSIEWKNDNLYQWRFNICQNEDCRQCPFALLCGGGCPYHRMQNNKSHCILYKQIFCAAVNMAYRKFKAASN